MRFRLKALSIHLLSSATVLTVVLGTLYLGWYRWPGWYLSAVSTVVLVLGGVDLALGPLLTFIVAAPGKHRRQLTRDIGVIAAVQMIALVYGATSLWNGRPLYYAFSEGVLQLVQSYDIDSPERALGLKLNPGLTPHWYSPPRWIWAPLPDDAEVRNGIIASAITGGTDVIGMPRYYKPWADGTSELRSDLKPLVQLRRFFAKNDLQSFEAGMRQLGLPIDQANAMPFLGRGGRRMLAVFSPTDVRLLTLFPIQAPQ
jgi:hypothetical protein